MSDLLFHPTAKGFPADGIPEVIIESEPALAEIYHLAWRQAWEHVFESELMPFSPWLSEGCGTDRIWIWDSCLMGMFCRYAPRVFPGRATLDDLYFLLDRPDAPIRIQHRDNPPLFAWIEWAYHQMDPNRERLAHVLPKLVKHYDFLETLDPAEFRSDPPPPITWQREDGGYCWSGCSSGMDNTPRGRGDYASIWWVDAPAQQALAADCICKIADVLGESEIAERFRAEFEAKKRLLQTFWDDETGAFLDLYRNGGGFCRVLTPASYWVILAGCASPEQRQRQFSLLKDPRKLGGIVPFPSVSRDDPDFDPSGRYWRGSVWLPTAYAGIKALERYGEYETASKLSLDLLRFMVRTYREYSPHTIWECYSPTGPRPATSRIKPVVRKDFCGWSALGPISLLIENVIGISGFDASSRSLTWNPGVSEGRSGIRNLNFCGGRFDLIREGKTIRIRGDFPVTVYFRDRKLECAGGENIFSL